MEDKTQVADHGAGGAESVPVGPEPQSETSDRWPSVDQFMSDDDLTVAAERIRTTVDWRRLPLLTALFERLPSNDRYWHELVALTLTSLEANGDLLKERQRQADAGASSGTPTQTRGQLKDIVRLLRDGLMRAIPSAEELQNVLWLLGEFERIALPDLSEPQHLHVALGRMVALTERNVETLADISLSLAAFVKIAAQARTEGTL